MHSKEKEMAILAAKAADERKAKDILIMEMAELTVFTDYFVICAAQSKPQVQAIADHIAEQMEKVDLKVSRQEGYQEGKWVLMDYGIFVVHIFQEEDRKFYDLEKLWADAPLYPLDEIQKSLS